MTNMQLMPLSSKEAVRLLKRDVEGWNNYVRRGGILPDMRGVDLRGADLSAANLTGAQLTQANLIDAKLVDGNLNSAGLSGASLNRAKLYRASLRKADLSESCISGAELGQADLSQANLRGANLIDANLTEANLSGTNLSRASLIRASLHGANLSGASLSAAVLRSADLRQADIGWATLHDCVLECAKLRKCQFRSSVLASVDLSSCEGLEECVHRGPSTIGQDTLAKTRGKLPARFLREAGFAPWEVLLAKQYDPHLTNGEFSELQYQIFDAKHNTIYLGGVFISYSHNDEEFADKIYDQLSTSGATVWLDKHSANAGDLKRQVAGAIRMQDIVVIVLSESAIRSDWVEHEMRTARKKEKAEKRDVLCPIAIDDAWHSKRDDPDWSHLFKKNVLDFSRWNTRAFDEPFQKLVRGLKQNYEVRTGSQRIDS